MAKRVYLEVPFSEKSEAKELGAWWDPKIKKWYVPQGVDPKKFVQWHKSEQADAEQIDLIESGSAATKKYADARA